MILHVKINNFVFHGENLYSVFIHNQNTKSMFSYLVVLTFILYNNQAALIYVSLFLNEQNSMYFNKSYQREEDMKPKLGNKTIQLDWTHVTLLIS